MGFYWMNNPSMDTAKRIANNLSRLMEQAKDLNTIAAVAKASGVGFGTVQRAKNGDGNLTVANLELLAHAFRRSARDLLVEDCVGYRTAAVLPSIGVAERSPLAAPSQEDSDIARVVDMMRSLTHDGRGRVVAYTQGIIENDQFRRKANGAR
jgi:transcriptional regulator with XRE-family HTH domain